MAFVDQGYTGEETANVADEHRIAIEMVKHTEAERDFVLLPRRWVVERSFAWAARFRRLAWDHERLPETLSGLHFFAILMLSRALPPPACILQGRVSVQVSGRFVALPDSGEPMLRFLILIAAGVILAIAFAPRVAHVLSWVLAFLIFLMLGDLLLTGIRRLRNGSHQG